METWCSSDGIRDTPESCRDCFDFLNDLGRYSFLFSSVGIQEFYLKGDQISQSQHLFYHKSSKYHPQELDMISCQSSWIRKETLDQRFRCCMYLSPQPIYLISSTVCIQVLTDRTPSLYGAFRPHPTNCHGSLTRYWWRGWKGSSECGWKLGFKTTWLVSGSFSLLSQFILTVPTLAIQSESVWVSQATERYIYFYFIGYIEKIRSSDRTIWGSIVDQAQLKN